MTSPRSLVRDGTKIASRGARLAFNDAKVDPAQALKTPPARLADGTRRQFMPPGAKSLIDITRTPEQDRWFGTLPGKLATKRISNPRLASLNKLPFESDGREQVRRRALTSTLVHC